MGVTRFRSNVVGVTAALKVDAMFCVEAVGDALVRVTREKMVPGHFFWTGLSRDAAPSGPAPDKDVERAVAEAGGNVGTDWVRTGPRSIQVRIRTPWAAYAEFGTIHMAPRPVLQPSIAEMWPSKLYETAAYLRARGGRR